MDQIKNFKCSFVLVFSVNKYGKDNRVIKITQKKLTLAKAPFNFQSWRPYKFVKIRSWSFSPPNLVLVCFGGVPGGGGGGAAAFGGALDWNRTTAKLGVAPATSVLIYKPN